MEDFTRIETFIKVAEAGSFSAAARFANSSVSAVARQINSLEKELGIRLLNRTTRSLSLTEPGRVFFERVSSISKQLTNAKSEAASFQENVKGNIRVALRASTATTIIIPALPQLIREYPDLGFDITLTDERLDLVARNIDVAVWMGYIPDSEIVARPLTRSERVICASPTYLRQHGTPRSPADLANHNCLMYTARTYNNIWGFSKGGEQAEVEIRGNFRSDNPLVLLSAATSDVGVVIAQEWTVRMAIAQGQLVRLLDDYTVRPKPEDSDLYAVYPSNRGLSRKVRIFVDFLVKLFQTVDVGEGRRGTDAETNQRIGEFQSPQS